MVKSTEKRHKRGDTREDGMVFLAYDKSYGSGEYWGTQEQLSKLRERSKKQQSNFRTTDHAKAYRKSYFSRRDVKDRRNALRNKGIGKGRGKRKDAITPEQSKQYNREWKKQKKITCPKYKLQCLIRSRMDSILRQKSSKRSKTLNDIIGCTFEQLKSHIESQFQEGMTWDNHGQFGWHVDHKIPMASAESIEDVYRLSHYTNLQPLWWRDNLTKWAN